MQIRITLTNEGKALLEILPIPAYRDNYIWLIIQKPDNFTLIVDPGEAQPVLKACKHYKLKPIGVLITHHHWDHVNGLPELSEAFHLPIYNSAGTLNFPEFEKEIKASHSPGHTQDHVVYLIDSHLFCGDVLFAGSCGRVFDGTASQLYHSLMFIASLPEQTKIYPAHEYTIPNLKFASIIEPHNIDIHQRLLKVKELRKKKLPTLPATLLEEKLTNPFLRCHLPSVKQVVERLTGQKLNSPEEVFIALREWKNNYRA